MTLGRKFAEQLTETGIDLDEDYTTEPITIGAGFNMAVQLFLFNDADGYGTFHFETTIDKDGTWHEIPIDDSTAGIQIVGENLDEVYDFGCLGTGFFRIRYDWLSGSAALDLHGIRKRIH